MEYTYKDLNTCTTWHVDMALIHVGEYNALYNTIALAVSDSTFLQ